MTKRHCYVADVGAAIERLADALDPDRNKPSSGDILDLLEWAEKDVLDMRQRLEQAHADIAGLHDQLEEPQITQDEYKLELEQLRQQLAGWNEKAKNWMASPEAGKQLEGYRAMGVKCAELEAERDQLRQQLTSRDAEIERLKTVPMRYRRMAFNAQLQNENTQLCQQLAEAYEAGKREASEDIEQAAFEKWLYDKCPSGDVDSVQRQWLESYEYAEFAGKRDATPEWQPIETAPRGVLEILLRSPNGKISNGYWGQECNRGKGAWVWPYVKSEPSHWMPLPAAPKGEA